jgi:hypothetical protein
MNPQPEAPLDLAERSLEQGLWREPLSNEAHAPIRAVVQAEWLASLPDSARCWRYRGIAIAATLATLAIFAVSWIQPAVGAIVFGTVVCADAGGLE